ncbi:MliC family protein [Echinimonas agarilytica]|uniref:MliC family protein n=1 Tax=Echinimonas agarilytica TaxID=1215918 RepID=A0AA41W899_9GAMM|nr:MliC family protein [Echinimonas agarilytica]MCM2680099.1 MliC family protein [Echinimonas agarilytica]
MQNFRTKLPLLALSVSTWAIAQPAFDCEQAQGQVEHAICASETLSELDQQLALVYQQAVDKTTDEAHLKAMQRGFIKGRNDCWKSESMNECIAQQYALRMTELQLQYQLISPLQEVRYRCGEQQQMVNVAFYGTEPASLVLSQDDMELWLYSQPVASGMHYTGQNIDFRGKGDAAVITHFDQPPVDCVVSR